MRTYTGKVAAVGSAAVVLAASAALATPGVAAAETKQVPCGGTVTAAPGDHIQGVTALGLPIDLGIVTDSVGSLLNGLCRVTVNLVDTVVAPIPAVGEPVAGTVNGVVEGTTGTVGQVTDAVGSLGRRAGEPAPAQPPAAREPRQPAQPRPETGGTGPADARPHALPAPNSPVVGGSTPQGMPWLGITPTWSPLQRYSGLPAATPGLFNVSPGVRYGGQIPGYSPEFGLLGEDGERSTSGDPGVRNAGEADALPAAADDSATGPALPTLLAVLALAGVSAGLVRTWVLRKATT